MKELESVDIAPPLPDERSRSLTLALEHAVGGLVYRRSLTAAHNALFFLVRRGAERMLGILHDNNSPVLHDFQGQEQGLILDGERLRIRLCPACYETAVALHRALPFTGPRPAGLATSIGCGDRLGMATPGHVRAVRKTRVVPFFAQQSIREMERTDRTPEDVINDSTWGVFQEGWRAGYGADADHLKTKADIDRCLAAGFTFYTFDPREHVDNAAHTDDLSTLRLKVDALPWDRLADDAMAMRERYLRTFSIADELTISFDEETLLRAAAKYGRALAHVADLYRHLRKRMGDRPFEVEVSVDETDTTTSPEEHFFIARELARLGVRWVSLAPRYVGRFEKGVDYIGDLAELDAAVARHAAIARHCGPYKLSIHSGSDKFSVYPIVARHTQGMMHLKTAGTSYLEALRAVALIAPPFFREILDFAFDHYAEDRATYHVSADPARALCHQDLADDELPSVLDNFDNRQILHVTYGSVLATQEKGGFRERLYALLTGDEETYYTLLEKHFDRHLEVFRQKGDSDEQLY